MLMEIGFEAFALAAGVAAVVGFVLGWVFNSQRNRDKLEALEGSVSAEDYHAAEQRAQAIEARSVEIEREYARTFERSTILEDSHQIIQDELAQERKFNLSLNAELSRERSNRQFLEEKIKAQNESIGEERRRLEEEFKTMTQVLTEQSRSVVESSQSSMENLLKPIAERLTRQTMEKPAGSASPPPIGRATRTPAKSTTSPSKPADSRGSTKPVSKPVTDKNGAVGRSKSTSATVEEKPEAVTKIYPAIAMSVDQKGLAGRATAKSAVAQPTSVAPKDQPVRQPTANPSRGAPAGEAASSAITPEQWGELDNFIRRTKNLKSSASDEK